MDQIDISLAELERLAALRSYGVLDTGADARFDRLTELTASLFQAPITLISLVDDSRQWFKSKLGLSACETPRGEAFCAHTLHMGRDAVLVVEDATRDPRFRDNPLVVGAPHIRFYAGAALTTPEGFNLGTLCVIDTKPRACPTAAEIEHLRALARIAVDELELGRSARAVEEKARLLKLAEAMSGVGHWRYQVVDGAITWSDEVYRIHGLDRETHNPNLEAGVGSYHPDDQAEVSRLLDRAVSTGEGFAFQLRLQKGDGELRHVASRAECERDDRGLTTAVIGVFQDVTDQVRAMEEVREKARRAMLAERIAGSGHWRIDDASRQVSCSEQLYEIIGLPDGVSLDRTAFLGLIHADDREAAKAQMERVRMGEAPSEPVRMRIARPDGSVRTLLCNMASERTADGAALTTVGTVMDITRQQEAEAAIARSEARYKLLTENANDIVTEVNRQGFFTYASPSIEALTGHRPCDVIGLSGLDFIHPDDRAHVQAAFRAGAGKVKGWTVEYRVLCKDGGSIWVEARPSSSDTGSVTDVLRDITARKAMEAALQRAIAEAEAAAAVKSEFLANMSHELRTPLTSILGFSQLLAPHVSDEGRGYHDRVVTAGRGLLAIVNDVLDFSKLEAGEVKIDLRRAEPAALFEDATYLLAPQADAKDLTLAFTAAEDMPAHALLDDTRVRQVLLNLVGNAVKFTSQGGVTVRLSRVGDDLRCEVVDTGQGVAPDQMERMFQRFSQVDAATSRTHGGTGLGLAICKGLVEAMGGRIGATSEVGAGSCFWFELPCAPVEIGKTPSSLLAAAADYRAVLSGVRVLVADDNPINRELIRLMLLQVGAEMTEATDGEAAVEAATVAPFDLILMDVRMPGQGGVESARLIRDGDGPNAQMPILAFTAESDDGAMPQAWLGIFDGRVHKPVVSEDLFRILARWATDGDVDLPSAQQRVG